MEELSYCTRTQFTTCANHSHFLIIGGKWKTNGWVKDCDDCYMCQSPLVSRCSLTWQLSCQWCKVCILNTDLKVTRSYANYSYYITYCIFNLYSEEIFTLSFVWFGKVLSNVWSCNQELVTIEPSTLPSYRRRRKHCFSDAHLQHPRRHRPHEALVYSCPAVSCNWRFPISQGFIFAEIQEEQIRTE